ncbi:hypothetical protein DFH09DRAFT_1088813 [Mycena vulgaris]|nr:hypothetical protein DFH09DRAFT_1088813 [Mycena vulgaris]
MSERDGYFDAPRGMLAWALVFFKNLFSTHGSSAELSPLSILLAFKPTAGTAATGGSTGQRADGMAKRIGWLGIAERLTRLKVGGREEGSYTEHRPECPGAVESGGHYFPLEEPAKCVTIQIEFLPKLMLNYEQLEQCRANREDSPLPLELRYAQMRAIGAYNYVGVDDNYAQIFKSNIVGQSSTSPLGQAAALRTVVARAAYIAALQPERTGMLNTMYTRNMAKILTGSSGCSKKGTTEEKNSLVFELLNFAFSARPMSDTYINYREDTYIHLWLHKSMIGGPGAARTPLQPV